MPGGLGAIFGVPEVLDDACAGGRRLGADRLGRTAHFAGARLRGGGGSAGARGFRLSGGCAFAYEYVMRPGRSVVSFAAEQVELELLLPLRRWIDRKKLRRQAGFFSSSAPAPPWQRLFEGDRVRAGSRASPGRPSSSAFLSKVSGAGSRYGRRIEGRGGAVGRAPPPRSRVPQARARTNGWRGRDFSLKMKARGSGRRPRLQAGVWRASRSLRRCDSDGCTGGSRRAPVRGPRSRRSAARTVSRSATVGPPAGILVSLWFLSSIALGCITIRRCAQVTSS